MSYKHLSLEERHYIEIEHKKGTSQKDIAKALGRDQGNISRELGRNKGLKGYRHKQANNFAQERHKTKAKSTKLTEEITFIIDGYIREDWSPEQVAGRLSNDDVIDLHHETIYQYILTDKKAGGDLYKHLRHQNKTYRKRYGHARNRTGIPNRVDIDERPKVANNRERVGDWEADTIIGKNHKGAIVTVDDRKSKLRLAFPLSGKKAGAVKDAMLLLFKPIQGFVKTITFDNGKEFTQHEKLAKELNCDTYFAKPYHSWERGQNENANGLLRQYFPKAMELTDVTIKQVFDAVDKLNSRPRKCLKFKTPYEVFKELTGVDVKRLMGYALMT
ncbi:Mobile element protein [Bathymodiolus heckerae thiotrophic gill symbiont]|uniref:IS30 family transposase n=1 Tax=Bathymodiolus heckerae thiotrophic gill symbiont TaxID=1052212 RepID=UPI0010B93E6A|nr:IS30 family transposase [Bathymodiolus heckerae thiotrophic gill symbiont]SHN93200.1 Mobile element protein [Bathymodiolus heckerae thiotrophic gill symbiont]